MTDSRYQYEKVNAIKAIVERPDGKVLLVQEPETNEWMPGHWGLPGGKPLIKESLYKAFKRKMREELGMDVEPSGLFRIEELLIEEKTALMVIAIVKLESEPALKGESKGYRWVGVEEVRKMNVAEYTEFYNKKLLLDYLTGNREVVGFDLIETQNYYDLSENPEYKRWWQSGRRKDTR